MSKDRDFKPLVYYHVRRGWFEQLQSLCEKKGKDNAGLTTFWKAFAIGASGQIPECIRQLSNFQARPDMQYPVSLALTYFHQKASLVDHDAVSNLRNSLSLSEDVAVSVPFLLNTRNFMETLNMCFILNS